jgi:hypothetical protein
MARLFKLPMLAMLVFAGLAGCRGPTELFSFIDRHCFVADWMNDHSCVSCRYAANCASQPTLPDVPRPLDLSTATATPPPAAK